MKMRKAALQSAMREHPLRSRQGTAAHGHPLEHSITSELTELQAPGCRGSPSPSPQGPVRQTQLGAGMAVPWGSALSWGFLGCMRRREG